MSDSPVVLDELTVIFVFICLCVSIRFQRPMVLAWEILVTSAFSWVANETAVIHGSSIFPMNPTKQWFYLNVIVFITSDSPTSLPNDSGALFL